MRASVSRDVGPFGRAARNRAAAAFEPAGVQPHGQLAQSESAPGPTIRPRLAALTSPDSAAVIQRQPPEDPHVFEYTDRVGRVWSRHPTTNAWQRPGPKGEHIPWTHAQEGDEEVVPEYRNETSVGTGGFVMDAAAGKVAASGDATHEIDPEAVATGHGRPVLMTVPLGHGTSSAQLHVHYDPDDPDSAKSHLMSNDRKHRFITNEHSADLMKQHVQPSAMEAMLHDHDMHKYGHVRGKHLSGLQHALRGDYK